jgi:hypothetical protein
MKNKFLPSLLLLATVCCYTAQAEAFEMADTFRSNGKIYVVVAVILTIFTGIIAYLVKIDRSVSKLEKAIKEKQEAK